MTVTEKLPGQAGKSGESAGNEVSLRLPWLCVWMWCQGGDGQFFRVLPGMRARVPLFCCLFSFYSVNKNKETKG